MKLQTNVIRIAVLAAASIGLAALAAWAGWMSVGAATPVAGAASASVVPAVMVSAEAPGAVQAGAPPAEESGEAVCGGCEHHRHRHGHHGDGEHNCPNCPHDGEGQHHRHGHGNCANCPYHETGEAGQNAPTAAAPTAAEGAGVEARPVQLASAEVAVQAADDVAAKRVPVVDADKCVGCGKCVKIAPKVFRLNPQTEKAEVVNPNGAPASVIQKAIEHCPTGAVKWSK